MYHKSKSESTRSIHSHSAIRKHMQLRWYAVRAPAHRNPDYRELKDGEWVLTYDTPDRTPLVAQYNSEFDVLICARSGEHLVGISSYVLLPSPHEVEIPSLLRR